MVMIMCVLLNQLNWAMVWGFISVFHLINYWGERNE